MSCNINEPIQVKPDYTELFPYTSDEDLTGWGIKCVGTQKYHTAEVFSYTIGNGITLIDANHFTIMIDTTGLSGIVEFDIRFTPLTGEPFPSPTHQLEICKGMA